MIARVVLSASASADQEAILTDLHGEAGWITAAKFRDLFHTLFLRLAEFPDSGAPRPLVGAGVRLGVVAPYLVLYRHMAVDDTVVVLRIVHGGRRVSGKLLGGPDAGVPADP